MKRLAIHLGSCLLFLVVLAYVAKKGPRKCAL